MLIDHVARIYFPDNLILGIIGRLSYPLFAWGIAKGFTFTSSYRKYLIRLLILALVSQLPYSLLFKNGCLNIGFTLMAGLIVLKIYSTQIPAWLKWPCIIALLMISHLGKFDYGIYGILTIFVFYVFRNKDYLAFVQGGLTLASVIIFKYEAIQLFAALSPILIMFLSSKDFRINRKLQYSFYPIHLTIILMLTYVMPTQ
jgi:TraX protein.